MLLAIETSSLVSSVALLHEQTLRAELTIQARLTHSEQLMPHIADMLDKASVGKADIDGIAVSIGPGSFTGLRIGLATAKGLAFAWQTPIVGIETSTSLAWNFVGNADKICPLIDAQKGNVYASVYKWNRGILETLDDVSVMPLETAAETGGTCRILRRRGIAGAAEDRRCQRFIPHRSADDGHSSGRKPGPGRAAAPGCRRGRRLYDLDAGVQAPERGRSIVGKTSRRPIVPMIVRKAEGADAQGIFDVETESFSVPWSLQAISRELANPSLTMYYVLADEDGTVAGYALTKGRLRILR